MRDWSAGRECLHRGRCWGPHCHRWLRWPMVARWPCWGEKGGGEKRARDGGRRSTFGRRELWLGGMLRWTRCRRRRVEWGRGLDGDRGVGGDGGGRGFGNVESSRFRRDLRCMAHGPGAKAHGVQRYAMGQSKTDIVPDGLAVLHTSAAADQWCLSEVSCTCWRLHSHCRPGWPDRVKRQRAPAQGPQGRTRGAPPPEMISDGLPVA